MRFLRADNDVETRYGGRFVQSIDGLSGQGAGGYADWFYFVNGIEADVGAAEYELSPGDVVQWDYRDWRGARRGARRSSARSRSRSCTGSTASGGRCGSSAPTASRRSAAT